MTISWRHFFWYSLVALISGFGTAFVLGVSYWSCILSVPAGLCCAFVFSLITGNKK